MMSAAISMMSSVVRFSLSFARSYSRCPYSSLSPAVYQSFLMQSARRELALILRISLYSFTLFILSGLPSSAPGGRSSVDALRRFGLLLLVGHLKQVHLIQCFVLLFLLKQDCSQFFNRHVLVVDFGQRLSQFTDCHITHPFRPAGRSKSYRLG